MFCGVLLFPGAASSSAQEINVSSSQKTFENLSVEKPELLSSSISTKALNSINVGRYFEFYYGPTYKYTFSLGTPPFVEPIYSGTLLYNSSKSSHGLYWYEGTVYLQ